MKKLNIKHIKEILKTESYELLSEYKNNYTPIFLQCPKGHKFSIVWANYQQGIRCKKCYFNKKRKSIDYIKKYLKREKYIFLDKDYINNYTKFKIECPEGHIYITNWNGFQRGFRCKKCYHNRTKKTIEEINNHIEKLGYKWISGTYKSTFSKLTMECPQGHIFTTRIDNLLYSSYLCPECTKIKRSLNMMGEKNWAWNNGSSFEPYCPIWTDQEFKKSIKERDGNICLNPYCFKQCKILSIHHIDHNKKNCHPSNLITLCNSCNSLANKDREWHKLWYQTIIQKKYKYK